MSELGKHAHTPHTEEEAPGSDAGVKRRRRKLLSSSAPTFHTYAKKVFSSVKKELHTEAQITQIAITILGDLLSSVIEMLSKSSQELLSKDGIKTLRPKTVESAVKLCFPSENLVYHRVRDPVPAEDFNDRYPLASQILVRLEEVEDLAKDYKKIYTAKEKRGEPLDGLYRDFTRNKLGIFTPAARVCSKYLWANGQQHLSGGIYFSKEAKLMIAAVAELVTRVVVGEAMEKREKGTVTLKPQHIHEVLREHPELAKMSTDTIVYRGGVMKTADGVMNYVKKEEED